MFTGIQDYTVRNGYYPREMGESCPPRKKTAEPTEYRGREMGEKPWEVPSREQQQAHYNKAQGSYHTAPSRSTHETRPREMGETPQEVARANSQGKREMTEQERRLDLYA